MGKHPCRQGAAERRVHANNRALSGPFGVLGVSGMWSRVTHQSAVDDESYGQRTTDETREIAAWRLADVEAGNRAIRRYAEATERGDIVDGGWSSAPVADPTDWTA